MRDHLANAAEGKNLSLSLWDRNESLEVERVRRGNACKMRKQDSDTVAAYTGDSPLSFIFTTSDPCPGGGSENGHNGLAWCWHHSREGGTDSVGKAQAFYSR